MDKIFEKIYNDNDFLNIIDDLLHNETVLKMKNFRQHYETSCFDHCLEASYLCYKISKKFKLDYVSSARAAMVHDLFLYDWRERQPDRKGLHAFTHGRTSYENACKIMEINDMQKDMILKHMWPLTISIPRYRETFILTLVDKYCALSESYNEIKSKHSKKIRVKKIPNLKNQEI